MEGAEFDLEAKLVEVLHSHTPNFRLFGRKTELLIFSEVQVGATIPDLVIVRDIGRGGAKRAVRLTLFESWVLGELVRAKQMRSQTLTRRLFTREQDMTTALKRLTRAGIVKQTRAGVFAVQTDFTARYEVLSIEAKLDRWRNAITQAKTYFRFSDRSFVALPSSMIAKRPEIGEACKAAGVGLIGVRPNGIQLHVSGQAKSPDRREWTWLLAKTGCLAF